MRNRNGEVSIRLETEVEPGSLKPGSLNPGNRIQKSGTQFGTRDSRIETEAVRWTWKD